MIFPDPANSFGSGSPKLIVILKAGLVLQGYGSGLKEEEETHMTHMNVNVTSSGQGTRTVVLQIPRVRPLITIFLRGTFLDFFFNGRYSTLLRLLPLRLRCVGWCWDLTWTVVLFFCSWRELPMAPLGPLRECLHPVVLHTPILSPTLSPSRCESPVATTALALTTRQDLIHWARSLPDMHKLFRWDLAEWSERVWKPMPKSQLSWVRSQPSFDTVKSEGRQMKQCWMNYKEKKSQKNSHFFSKYEQNFSPSCRKTEITRVLDKNILCK